jgi:hypothetical protein
VAIAPESSKVVIADLEGASALATDSREGGTRWEMT